MGILVYDDRQTEVDFRIFTQSTQDQRKYFILMLRSGYRQRSQNQEVVPWISGPKWTQIVLVIWKAGVLIQAY